MLFWFSAEVADVGLIRLMSGVWLLKKGKSTGSIMSLVLLGSKGGAGEDVGLHQKLTPVSAERAPQDLGSGRSCIWGCCGRKINLHQPNLRWEGDESQHSWACPAGKPKEFLLDQSNH